MKKETVIAIIFGIILGGILAVILLAKNKEKQLEKNKTIAPMEKITPSSQANNSNVQPLEVNEPQDGMIVNKNSITIQAKTIKDALVIIQSPIKDMSFKNDKEQFKIDFPLVLGENVIQITVYPKDTQLRSQEKTLRVYYFEEGL